MSLTGVSLFLFSCRVCSCSCKLLFLQNWLPSTWVIKLQCTEIDLITLVAIGRACSWLGWTKLIILKLYYITSCDEINRSKLKIFFTRLCITLEKIISGMVNPKENTLGDKRIAADIRIWKGKKNLIYWKIMLRV